MQWTQHQILHSWKRIGLSWNRRTARATSSLVSLSEVPCLRSWNVGEFRNECFVSAKPHRLPFQAEQLPPAVSKWFIRDSVDDLNLPKARSQSSELRTSFWSDYKDILVSLELTESFHSSKASPESSFQRAEAPLKLLLTYLGDPRSPTSSSLQAERSIYLAQCSLSSLPESLQHDLPTPLLVLQVGKGDVYDSSLWLGRPPTYTPLHRDPNPNFFLQLAGTKSVRLFPPEVGDYIFGQVQERLQNAGSLQTQGQSSAVFRGAEMMAGPERELMHQAVWQQGLDGTDIIQRYGQQAEIGMGEALFIPKGWWHSVKGIGEGVVASANWWFR